MIRIRPCSYMLMFVAIMGALFTGWADVEPVEHEALSAEMIGRPSLVASPMSSQDAVQTFTETLRRYERIQFDELVTGDASLFPTIFDNDPNAAGEAMTPGEIGRTSYVAGAILPR